jgi:hypothetical protein
MIPASKGRHSLLVLVKHYKLSCEHELQVSKQYSSEQKSSSIGLAEPRDTAFGGDLRQGHQHLGGECRFLSLMKVSKRGREVVDTYATGLKLLQLTLGCIHSTNGSAGKLIRRETLALSFNSSSAV